MSVVIVFVLVMIGFSSWWLVRQRVMAKPWLEVGADPIGGPGTGDLPTLKIALGVFLAVVGALFALFASAYFMRMDYADWRAMPVPPIVWVNTGMLVLASVLLQCALIAAAGRRRDPAPRPRRRHRRRSPSSPASSPPGPSSRRAASSSPATPPTASSTC
jgi:cytochrome c oxidase subunit III